MALSESVEPSGDPYINGMLAGTRWAMKGLTYSFPTSVSQYDGYSAGSLDTFRPLNAAQRSAAVQIFSDISAFTQLTFDPAPGGSGILRVGQADFVTTGAGAYYPSEQPHGGDAWFSTTLYQNPVRGNYDYQTFMHEIGHTLGLQHPTGLDNYYKAYTLMSYSSWPGDIYSSGSVEPGGSNQTYMMYDISALQYLYGANFETNAGNTTYKWSPDGPYMWVDGSLKQLGQEANRLLLTIWDGGGEDTYDFSNYSNDLKVDLNPGAWTTASPVQLVDLNYNIHLNSPSVEPIFAPGNIANALLHDGDSRSLIENAIGGPGNDVMIGNNAGNKLIGGGGNDLLVGGGGADRLEGGEGADTFVYQPAGDSSVSELDEIVGFATGVDKIDLRQLGPVSVSWTERSDAATATPYNLVQAAGNDGIVTIRVDGAVAPSDFMFWWPYFGTDGDDLFHGTGGPDEMLGRGGNDLLDGGAGADKMAGGPGDDGYFVDDAGDQVTENKGEGIDEAVSLLRDYTLRQNVENLTLGDGALNGGGNALANLITGNGAANLLSGGDGDDRLTGGDGDDTLDGGNGADVLVGGAGNDTYKLDFGDSIVEAPGGGIDTAISATGYSLPAEVENLILTGSYTNGYGNDLANLIIGSDDSDNLYGNAGNDDLRGNAGGDQLDGGDGDDLLWGGEGQDLLTGGPGSDRFIYHAFSESTGGVGYVDSIQDFERGLDKIDLTALGPVSLHPTHSYDNFFGDRYYLEVTGSGGTLTLQTSVQVSEADIMFTPAGFGTPGDDVIVGSEGVDRLEGLGGSDQLSGLGGDDILDGGAGADRMAGGTGNDIYFVDTLADQVTEQAGEGIADEVRTSVSNYALPDNVEILTYVGAGGGVLLGNGGDNRLNGGAGNDFIDLRQGGDDVASGGSGNDVLYYGAAFSSADRNDGGAGTDAVILQGSFAGVLTADSLTNVEALSLQSGTVTRWGGSGTASYDYDVTAIDANVGAGRQLIVNASALVLGEDFRFDGSAESDGSFFIYAGAGRNDLVGGAQFDTFFFEGNWSSDDVVDGGAGRDVVIVTGGSAMNHVTIGSGVFHNVEAFTVSDVFVSDRSVTPSYDIVIEDGNVVAGGSLIVNGSTLTQAFQTFSLDAHAVTGNLQVYGGSGTDTIVSGSGNDFLYGGDGGDVMTGGSGADVYHYRALSESAPGTPDRITDFLHGTDRIDLAYIDADTVQAGNQAFTFRADGLLEHAGDLRSTWDPANHWFLVEGDVNGDGQADFAIQVVSQGDAPLTGPDFIP